MKEFCQKLDLQSGQRVLDVGCGTGGSAFYMARKYGVEVRGLDLSTNMITLALENQAECELEVRRRVCFEITDITACAFEENSFDVIYSRDTILHIEDKETLFSNFLVSFIGCLDGFGVFTPHLIYAVVISYSNQQS